MGAYASRFTWRAFSLAFRWRTTRDDTLELMEEIGELLLYRGMCRIMTVGQTDYEGTWQKNLEVFGVEIN
jgi:hypothetical protein